MSSNLERQRRFASLSNYSDNILTTLKKIVDENKVTVKNLDDIYFRYVRFIGKHIDDYIRADLSVKKKIKYYEEVMDSINSLITTIKSMFATQIAANPIFNVELIRPLNDLFSLYSQTRSQVYEAGLKAAAASASSIPVATAEIVPATTATRFAANTNVPEGGGFVSRIRDFVGRAFSNINNNPIPEAQAVAVNPTPRPPENQPSTSFRSGRNIAPRFQIVGGGSAAATETPDPEAEAIQYTGGGRS
jgi:hypothetical protein